jgi:hypothetical protein
VRPLCNGLKEIGTHFILILMVITLPFSYAVQETGSSGKQGYEEL